MTAWIAIVLCLLPLIGHVQVSPVRSMTTKHLNMGDLGLELLEKVTCGDNITFTSPINVMVKCHNDALLIFINEFQNASTLDQCQGGKQHIQQTLEVLNMAHSKTQTQCNLTTTVHNNFGSFVHATKEFAQKFNTVQTNQD